MKKVEVIRKDNNMMKSKTEQLKELFDKWRRAQSIEDNEVFKSTSVFFISVFLDLYSL